MPKGTCGIVKKRALVLCAYLRCDRAHGHFRDFLQPMSALHVAAFIDRTKFEVRLHYEMYHGPFVDVHDFDAPKHGAWRERQFVSVTNWRNRPGAVFQEIRRQTLLGELMAVGSRKGRGVALLLHARVCLDQAELETARLCTGGVPANAGNRRFRLNNAPPASKTRAGTSSRFDTATVTCVIGLPSLSGASLTALTPPSIPGSLSGPAWMRKYSYGKSNFSNRQPRTLSKNALAWPTS